MIHNILKDKKVLLASASPRRRLIFDLLGIKALVIPTHIDEPTTLELPYIQAIKHAKNKVMAISGKIDEDAVIIGADTVVYLNGMILGKPRSREDATDYLRILSGKTHSVYTGLCVKHCQVIQCDYARSRVTFGELSEQDIEEYIITREPFDKAGAYGVQGFGSQFITRINGCYFNVMGFPVNLFYQLLKGMFQE
ncbi:MAG: septum formation protein Maf [Candidatus Cloacimonetes bacterium]|nr:septum formation protein Maf [Candidatus Cloacimonadota bacterium]